jgi:hypothetical protein
MVNLLHLLLKLHNHQKILSLLIQGYSFILSILYKDPFVSHLNHNKEKLFLHLFLFYWLIANFKLYDQMKLI